MSSESDLDEFVLVAVVSPSDANDKGLESLVVVAVEVVSPSDANDEGLESLVVVAMETHISKTSERKAFVL